MLVSDEIIDEIMEVQHLRRLLGRRPSPHGMPDMQAACGHCFYVLLEVSQRPAGPRRP